MDVQKSMDGLNDAVVKLSNASNNKYGFSLSVTSAGMPTAGPKSRTDVSTAKRKLTYTSKDLNIAVTKLSAVSGNRYAFTRRGSTTKQPLESGEKIHVHVAQKNPSERKEHNKANSRSMVADTNSLLTD